jgi:hypothetical protein
MAWWLASAFFFWLVLRELRVPSHRLHSEPIYPPYLLLVLALAIICAWQPLAMWRFEARLARAASALADGRRASVHCNTLFDTMLDPNMLYAGHANIETGRIVLQKPWCSRLQTYLSHPAGASDVERYSLHLFTHEAMHVRGEKDEARTDCQAMQRHVRAAGLLGVPAELARGDVRDYFRSVFGQSPSTESSLFWKLTLLPASFERQRRQMTDGAVGALLVVDRQPFLGDGPRFVQ